MQFNKRELWNEIKFIEIIKLTKRMLEVEQIGRIQGYGFPEDRRR